VIEGRLEGEEEEDPAGRPKKRLLDLQSGLFSDLANGRLRLRFSRLNLPTESVELPLAEATLLPSEEKPAPFSINHVAERDDLQESLLYSIQ